MSSADVAEELPERFRGRECDVFDQRDEIRGVYRASADFAKCYSRNEISAGNDVGEITAPTEIRIFFPIRSAYSSTATRRAFTGLDRAEESRPPPSTRASKLRIKSESH